MIGGCCDARRTSLSSSTKLCNVWSVRSSLCTCCPSGRKLISERDNSAKVDKLLHAVVVTSCAAVTSCKSFASTMHRAGKRFWKLLSSFWEKNDSKTWNFVINCFDDSDYTKKWRSALKTPPKTPPQSLTKSLSLPSIKGNEGVVW